MATTFGLERSHIRSMDDYFGVLQQPDDAAVPVKVECRDYKGGRRGC